MATERDLETRIGSDELHKRCETDGEHRNQTRTVREDEHMHIQVAHEFANDRNKVLPVTPNILCVDKELHLFEVYRRKFGAQLSTSLCKAK